MAFLLSIRKKYWRYCRKKCHRHPVIGPAALLIFFVSVSGCALFAAAPPAKQSNICEIFRQEPGWYDHARNAQEKWGTPIATQMAFIYQESSFRSHAKPPRDRLLGFIPWFRPSSAYGYAQAQDPVWGEYEEEVGGLLTRRTHMKYATDFIGWYNRRSHERLGISLYNPEHLYLAYHEGPTGYRRGYHRNKPQVLRSAAKVSGLASRYQAQLAGCESEFRCRHFWQVWPFCRG